jgi:hypothetical protein
MAEPKTVEGRALLADRVKGFEDDASNRALPSRGTAAEVNRAMLIEDWTERILAIEAEAAAQERERQISVRKDWGSLPHGEFHTKYGNLARKLYLLPTNCTCRDCQMWSS